MMDAAALSKAIREKKKKLKNSSPELAADAEQPDMNPLGIYDTEQKGRIEETLKSPKKINADDTMMGQKYDGVGLSPEEKTRMGRLRKYMSTMSLSRHK